MRSPRPAGNSARARVGLTHIGLAALLAAPAFASTPPPAGTALAAQSLRELGDLSIEELSQIEVTSASRRAEPLSEVTSAIYVITGDDIRRAGAATLAEALRLAPNLEVARINSQNYAISARGMNSVNASNKLLALIDGRSVYTPFFSSIFWDQQDVMLADIERIEVISGPGGTLWGANAMNGVINVVTKSSASTQGGLVDVKGGDFVSRAAARWGGRLGESATYRGYALGFVQDHTTRTDGSDAMDDWRGKQAGFRTDFGARDDRFTVQGDAYENVIDTPGGRRSGGNVLGRWTRQLADGASLQVQAYYDQQRRNDVAATGGGSSARTRTIDVEAEHVFTWRGVHRIVWGGGYRNWDDRFVNTANPFVLVPESERLGLTNLFAQDTIALRHDLRLVLGSKFEYSTFSGWAVMPNVRLGWQADARNFLWGAVSRAVRSPSRLERDLFAPGIVDPSPGFDSEKLIAYETGWRVQLAPNATISVSAYYNDYTDLRTTSPDPVTVLPVKFGNGWEGHTYGIDVWGSYSPFAWWRIDPGFSLLHENFHLKPGQADIAGIQSVLGHDPNHEVFVKSYMDLPQGFELYVGLRQIGSLPDIDVPSYFEVDVRLGWRVTPALELSLTGHNLMHAQHAEQTQPPILEIPRSWFAGVRYEF